MIPLSNKAKQELYRALNGKQSGMFVINNKIVSIEVDNFDDEKLHDFPKDLSQEIEEYSELKESLTRYINKPNMERYDGKSLKEMRHARRK